MRRLRTVLVVLLVIGGLVGPVAAAGAGDGTAARPADAECAFPVTETDATGTEVTLEDEPETVVTLNPSAAQTMWEIGAEEKVVGVTEHAANLEGADERTNVSTDAETIEPERVVDLEPDLVLAPKSKVVSEDLVERLREAGLTVYHFPSAESIDDVRERTLLTGELVGECEGARETVEWMDREIGVVESALEGEERPDVLYTFFGYTAGDGTFVDEVIEAGGGTNLAAEAGVEGYQQLSEETVVDEDPDWILLNSDSPELPDSEAYETTTAVQEDQVLVVDINHLNRPAPRIVHAITTVAETLHPDAYATAAADGNASEPNESEASDDPDEASTGGDGADDQPGFGAVVAAAALALAALGTIRHRDDGS